MRSCWSWLQHDRGACRHLDGCLRPHPPRHQLVPYVSQCHLLLQIWRNRSPLSRLLVEMCYALFGQTGREDGRKVSAYTLAGLRPHRFQYYHHHHDRGEPTERGVKSPKSKQSGRCWRVVRNTAMVWSTMDEGDLTKVTGHRTLSAAVSAGWDAVRK